MSHNPSQGISVLTLEEPCDYLEWRVGSGGTVEIYDIQVGSARREGKGRKLLEKLFSQLDRDTHVWAITRADNDMAIEFYEHCCFRVVGVLRQFYGDERRVDAIMFGRKAGGAV